MTDHVSLRPSPSSPSDALDRALVRLVREQGLDAVWVGDADGLLVRGAARHSGAELETYAALAPLGEGPRVEAVRVGEATLLVGAVGKVGAVLQVLREPIAKVLG